MMTLVRLCSHVLPSLQEDAIDKWGDLFNDQENEKKRRGNQQDADGKNEQAE